MHSSKIIEIDGVFVGVAVRLPTAEGWRFVSADDRANGADGVVGATLEDARMAARRAFYTSRVGEMA